MTVAVATGLGWYLERVDVDWRFINKGHNNAFKASIQEMSMSAVEEWISLDDALGRDKYLDASSLYDQYVNWHRRNVHANTPRSFREFGLDMTSLANKNQFGVSKKRSNGVTSYQISSVVTQQIVDTVAVHSEISGYLSGVKCSSLDADYCTVQGTTALSNDFDVPQNPIIADFSGMTPMQVLRARLKSEKEDETVQ